MLALQQDQPATRTYTDPLGVVELQIHYYRTMRLLSLGYDVQYKRGLGRVYCLIYCGGMNRHMVGVDHGADPVEALAAAMDKAKLLADADQATARG